MLKITPEALGQRKDLMMKDLPVLSELLRTDIETIVKQWNDLKEFGLITAKNANE